MKNSCIFLGGGMNVPGADAPLPPEQTPRLMSARPPGWQNISRRLSWTETKRIAILCMKYSIPWPLTHLVHFSKLVQGGRYASLAGWQIGLWWKEMNDSCQQKMSFWLESMQWWSQWPEYIWNIHLSSRVALLHLLLDEHHPPPLNVSKTSLNASQYFSPQHSANSIDVVLLAKLSLNVPFLIRWLDAQT